VSVRVYRRVGRRTGISLPLWLALLFLPFYAAAWLAIAFVWVVVVVATLIVQLVRLAHEHWRP
jgi:hypothetical protein